MYLLAFQGLLHRKQLWLCICLFLLENPFVQGKVVWCKVPREEGFALVNRTHWSIKYNQDLWQNSSQADVAAQRQRGEMAPGDWGDQSRPAMAEGSSAARSRGSRGCRDLTPSARTSFAGQNYFVKRKISACLWTVHKSARVRCQTVASSSVWMPVLPCMPTAD